MGKILTVAALALTSSAWAGLEKVPLDFAQIKVDGSSTSLYVEGYLPNTCYGEPRGEVRRIKSGAKVMVVSNVEGENCAEVIRMFDLDIELGEFGPGDYKVYLQRGTRWASTLDFEIYEE